MRKWSACSGPARWLANGSFRRVISVPRSRRGKPTVRKSWATPSVACPKEDWSLIQDARQLVPVFLRIAYESCNWSDFDLIGFTSTFEQTMPSMCLAKMIRQGHPRVKIAAGGDQLRRLHGACPPRSVPRDRFHFDRRGRCELSLSAKTWRGGARRCPTEFCTDRKQVVEKERCPWGPFRSTPFRPRTMTTSSPFLPGPFRHPRRTSCRSKPRADAGGVKNTTVRSVDLMATPWRSAAKTWRRVACGSGPPRRAVQPGASSVHGQHPGHRLLQDSPAPLGREHQPDAEIL